jgi:flagellar hook assembly protein FlgD
MRCDRATLNPFNPRVTIPFELREDANVTLSVYDVAGRLVKTLVSEWMQRGAHTASWDGRSVSGAQASSGVYFCRLRAGGFSETRKMVLLK